MSSVPHKHPDARTRELEAEPDWRFIARDLRVRVDAAEAEVSRLREIERVFNEGWLPPLPAEPASLRLRSLNRLRELIPEALEAGGGETET